MREEESRGRKAGMVGFAAAVANAVYHATEKEEGSYR